MQRRLPERIHPYKACEHGLILEGVCPLSALARLGDIIFEPKGDVSAVLRFGYDAEHNPVITGQVEGELTLQCQRCMAPYSHPMRVDIRLALARSIRESEGLTSAFEPYIAESDDASLYELIEDELILNLPAVARHPGDQCLARVEEQWHEDAEPPRENPFAALKRLKTEPGRD